MKDSLLNERIPIQCSSDSVSSILTCDITFENDALEIRLIDTNDIFTFYQCTTTGASYVHLKSEQDLRVDFECFVKKVVELFYQAKSGRVRALFSRENMRLVFVEQNEFRNIVRLELRFKVPGEGDYKRYLAEMISKAEVLNVRLRKENCQVREAMANLEGEMRGRVSDLTERNRVMEERAGVAERRVGELERENEVVGREREEAKKRIVEIEKERSGYKFEIEKYKIEEYKKEEEVGRLREAEVCRGEVEREIKVANEIIRKLREDAKRAGVEAEGLKEKIEKLKSECEKNAKGGAETKKLLKERGAKIRVLRDALKKKEDEVNNLEMDKKQLTKKMEDAKFVYSHFYKKRGENEMSSASENQNSTFSVQPESPPR